MAHYKTKIFGIVIFASLAFLGFASSRQGTEDLKLTIIPKPKEIRIHNSWILLPTEAWIACFRSGESFSVASEAFLKELTNGSADRFGLKVVVKRMPVQKGPIGILKLVTKVAECDESIKLDNEVPPNSEGYALRTSPQGVTIGARSAAGLYYGIQTFFQLVQRRADQWALPQVEIVDEPDWAFRGVHLVMRNGPQGEYGTDMDLLEKVIKISGQLKLNRLVLQIDHALKYDSHPELDGDVSKERFKRLLEVASDNYIEVIPQLEAYGHQRWFIFRSGKTHMELAQRNNSNAYCPCDSRVYRLFFDLWDEVIPLIKPSFAHIGHDEVLTFTDCDACQNQTNAAVFASSVQQFHDYFQKRGIKTMIWGDLLLNKKNFPSASYAHGDANGSGAYKAIDLIPKDVVILDWHYKEGKPGRDQYPTSDYLINKGFPVIGVPWYRTVNVASFSKYLKERKGMGMVVSTWTGFHKSPNASKNFASRYNMAKGIVLGGENFWRIDSKNSDLPYDEEKVLADSIRMGRLSNPSTAN